MDLISMRLALIGLERKSDIRAFEILQAMLESSNKAQEIADEIRSDPALMGMETKDDQSVVGAADIKIQAMFKEQLIGKFGGQFIGEESPRIEGEDDSLLFICDPVDGTTNFAAGVVKGGFGAIKHSCTSIAAHLKDGTKIGVVKDLDTGDIYFAVSGRGAFVFDAKNDVIVKLTANKDHSFVECNGKPIISFGHASRDMRKALTDEFKVAQKEEGEKLEKKIKGSTREMGATALDICAVAGSATAVMAAQANWWDHAAAMIVVEESGGKTKVVKADKDKGEKYDTILACHPDLFPRMEIVFDKQVTLARLGLDRKRETAR